jgi:hypothetical protein
MPFVSRADVVLLFVYALVSIGRFLMLLKCKLFPYYQEDRSHDLSITQHHYANAFSGPQCYRYTTLANL